MEVRVLVQLNIMPVKGVEGNGPGHRQQGQDQDGWVADNHLLGSQIRKVNF